jgi:hypothetical protein
VTFEDGRRRPARARSSPVWFAAPLSALACSAAPWHIGATLTGEPSIPPSTARPPPAEARRIAAAERQANHPALELVALATMEEDFRLNAVLRAEPTRAERSRLIALLLARADDFHHLHRAVPESRDLEWAARLDPGIGAAIAARRVDAAVAAGDVWKAIGAREDAQAAFALAAALGGVDPPQPAEAAATVVPPTVIPPNVEDWVVGSASVSLRVLPLVSAFPGVLDDVSRAVHWANLLLDEDPSSPDVLELAAFAFGRARRYGGTERMLMELAFHTPDRRAGLARGAAVWDRLGRPREACAQWIRAARWRDDPEDGLWRKAIACARADPGAGDWREIRSYVLARARPERRDAIAAALDSPPGP